LRRQGLSARSSFRVDSEVEPDGHIDFIQPGKEKYWSNMTQQERDAVEILGFSEATWTDPDLLDDADYPLNRSWGSLTTAQQSAASTLGYQHDDFEPLEGGQQDNEI
jgi:hypothetical protein